MELGINTSKLQLFTDLFFNNFALARAGTEAAPVVEALLGGLSDEDVLYMVSNSVNMVDVLQLSDVMQLRELLSQYELGAEFVLREDNFPKFMESASLHHYQLLVSVPGGMVWAEKQVRDFLT